MSTEPFSVAHRLTRPYRDAHKALRYVPKKYRPILRIIHAQLPAVTAIAAILILERFKGLTSGSYAVIVLCLLVPVAYVPLRFGLRHGLVTSSLLITFNSLLLAGNVRKLSLTDQNLRTILLLGIVLSFLSVIIGRLKERNDALLFREKTARLEAENNVRRLRFMAESMPQKIFTTLPNGASEYANSQWTEYTGRDLDKLQLEDWQNLVHSADSDENIRRWKQSLAEGVPFEYEHRLRRADGQYRWHLTRAQPLRDENGDISIWVGSSTDIEDIRRTRKLEADTARLTKQREELLTLNTAKDEFISLASHQLRTPATGVKQYLGMALEGYGGPVPSRLRKLLKQAYESNERQLTIVDDLLKVAQVDAGKVRLQKQPLDLVGLIKDVIQGQTDKFATREQTVIFSPRRRKLMVVADRDRLRMVIENILDNASKYSPPGKNIEITATKSNDQAILTIRDEGVGIDPKQKDRVFEKFSRIDNPLSVQVGGTGLGLYWVKKIIDLHEGAISIDSKLGTGTTFTVTFPAK